MRSALNQKWQKQCVARVPHTTTTPSRATQPRLEEEKEEEANSGRKWRLPAKQSVHQIGVSGVHTSPCPCGSRRVGSRCASAARWRGEPPRGELDRSAPLWQAGAGLCLHCTNSGRRNAVPVSCSAHAPGILLVPGRPAPTASNVYLEISRHNYRLMCFSTRDSIASNKIDNSFQRVAVCVLRRRWITFSKSFFNHYTGSALNLKIFYKKHFSMGGEV